MAKQRKDEFGARGIGVAIFLILASSVSIPSRGASVDRFIRCETFHVKPDAAVVAEWENSFFDHDVLWSFTDSEELDTVLAHESLSEDQRARLRASKRLEQDLAYTMDYLAFYGSEKFHKAEFIEVPRAFWLQLPRAFLDRVYQTQASPRRYWIGSQSHAENAFDARSALLRAGIKADLVEAALDLVFREGEKAYLRFESGTWLLADGPMRSKIIESATALSNANRALKCVVGFDRRNFVEIADALAGERDPRPIREALSAALEASGGAAVEMDLVDILHPFIKSMANRYCAASGPNCFNSALNVNLGTDFGIRHLQLGDLDQALSEGYRLVGRTEELRAGDLLAYFKWPGGVLSDNLRHVSTYVTDSIVFTKNGLSKQSPYMLQDRELNEKNYFPAGDFAMLAYRKIGEGEIVPPRSRPKGASLDYRNARIGDGLEVPFLFALDRARIWLYRSVRSRGLRVAALIPHVIGRAKECAIRLRDRD